jgi:hypothetical protein
MASASSTGRAARVLGFVAILSIVLGLAALGERLQDDEEAPKVSRRPEGFTSAPVRPRCKKGDRKGKKKRHAAAAAAAAAASDEGATAGGVGSFSQSSMASNASPAVFTDDVAPAGASRDVKEDEMAGEREDVMSRFLRGRLYEGLFLACRVRSQATQAAT